MWEYLSYEIGLYLLCSYKYFKYKVIEKKLMNIENISQILNLLIKANKSAVIGAGWGDYIHKSKV